MSASIDDVRDILHTSLQDQDIQSIIDRVAREVDRAYAADAFVSPAHRADLEASMAALRIVSGFDRRASSVRLGSASRTYETRLHDHYRAMVRRYDPGDEFSLSGVRRDSDRVVHSTGGAR